MCSGLAFSFSSFVMASCKCCCFMQPLAQLSPSAFATRDAWPWATLFWDAEGLGKSVAKETSLPWSQPQFRPPRGGDRAVTAVQPWAAGMGGQHWSMDWTLNTMSVAIPARANAKQPVVCLSVCLSAAEPGNCCVSLQKAFPEGCTHCTSGNLGKVY